MATNNGKNGNSKREFDKPDKVHNLCEQLQDIEDRRARERARINSLMNGQKPYTKSEEEKFNIEFNVNFGEGKRIMLDAQRQLNNALLHPGILFNCSLQEGPEDKRDEYSLIFTKNIHVPIQRGRSGKRWNFTIRSRNGTVCMHGIGVLLWPNSFRWLPRFVPLEDALIPTDTFCDFTNLRYFAVNLYLSPGELIDLSAGDSSDPRWNRGQIKKILDAQKNLYTESTPSTWKDQPEYMKQIHDQNRGYYFNDALPKIKLRAFYWQDIKVPGKWYRCIIQRETYGDAKVDEWVYDGGDEPFADSIDQIIHVCYGDGNIVAPLKYHSVRGLGVDLFAPIELVNRLRCEFMWATFEHMKVLFLVKDPADRDRLKQVALQQFGFIPEGLTIVPRDQRHQIDPRLIESAMAQTRQIMQESSASFVSNPDNGTEKEMTAKEATIKLNQANVMVSGMLQLIYVQEGFLYEEIVRRFCNARSEDAEVKQFQKKCLAQGIPERYMEYELWKVSPERVLGGGDRTQAEQQSAWLFQNRTAYGPESQQKILRLVTGTILDDPAKASLLVPSEPQTSTRGTELAEELFGTMMTGNQCAIRSGIDIQGYVAKSLQMMGNVIKRIESTGNVGTIEEAIGLQTVGQNVGQYIAVLAQDPAQKQLTKQFADALGNLMNLLKGFVARIMESRQQKEPGGDPQALAKAEALTMMAQLKAKISQENAALKRQHKEMDFHLEQQRKNLETIGEIDRENLRQHHELLNQSAQNALELMHKSRKASDKEPDA